MADQVVEAKYCPGWIGINGQKHQCGGRASQANLLAKTERYRKWIDDKGVHHSETLSEPTYPEMCSRCSRQRTKYNEEHGAREERQRTEQEQRLARFELYVKDVRDAAGDNDIIVANQLVRLIELIEALEERERWPPFAKLSEARWRSMRPDHLGGDERWSVLRLIAGLEQ